MKTARIELTDDEMRALEKIASKEGCSVSEVIHRRVEPWLRRQIPRNGAGLPPGLRICPQPLVEKIDLRALDRPQGPHSGINAIIGHWPGDESDEELLAALDKLSCSHLPNACSSTPLFSSTSSGATPSGGGSKHGSHCGSGPQHH